MANHLTGYWMHLSIVDDFRLYINLRLVYISKGKYTYLGTLSIKYNYYGSWLQVNIASSVQQFDQQ